MDPISFIVANLTGSMRVPSLPVPRHIVRDGHEQIRKPRKKVYKRRPGATPRPTKDTITAIVAYRRAGASVAQAAEKFGVHPRTVWRYVRDFGGQP